MLDLANLGNLPDMGPVDKSALPNFSVQTPAPGDLDPEFIQEMQNIAEGTLQNIDIQSDLDIFTEVLQENSHPSGISAFSSTYTPAHYNHATIDFSTLAFCPSVAGSSECIQPFNSGLGSSGIVSDEHEASLFSFNMERNYPAPSPAPDRGRSLLPALSSRSTFEFDDVPSELDFLAGDNQLLLPTELCKRMVATRNPQRGNIQSEQSILEKLRSAYEEAMQLGIDTEIVASILSKSPSDSSHEPLARGLIPYQLPSLSPCLTGMGPAIDTASVSAPLQPLPPASGHMHIARHTAEPGLQLLSDFATSYAQSQLSGTGSHLPLFGPEKFHNEGAACHHLRGQAAASRAASRSISDLEYPEVPPARGHHEMANLPFPFEVNPQMFGPYKQGIAEACLAAASHQHHATAACLNRQDNTGTSTVQTQLQLGVMDEDHSLHGCAVNYSYITASRTRSRAPAPKMRRPSWDDLNTSQAFHLPGTTAEFLSEATSIPCPNAPSLSLLPSLTADATASAPPASLWGANNQSEAGTGIEPQALYQTTYHDTRDSLADSDTPSDDENEDIINDGNDDNLDHTGSRSQQGSLKRDIILDQLRQVYEYPINEAAKRLGVGVTVLKKYCRKYKIMRWPYRKLKSIDKLSESIGAFPRFSPQSKERAQQKLEAARKTIFDDPSKPLTPDIKQMRQINFKLEYKSRFAPKLSPRSSPNPEQQQDHVAKEASAGDGTVEA